jgi:hypothetical protein
MYDHHTKHTKLASAWFRHHCSGSINVKIIITEMFDLTVTIQFNIGIHVVVLHNDIVTMALSE